MVVPFMTGALEYGLVWKQRFIKRVTDPDKIAEALEACADTYFRTKVYPEYYENLQGELFEAWCKDRLEPGRAWSNTAVALWTPPVRKPVSGLVALTIAGVVTVYVYLVYTEKIPGGVPILNMKSPIEVVLKQ